MDYPSNMSLGPREYLIQIHPNSLALRRQPNIDNLQEDQVQHRDEEYSRQMRYSLVLSISKLSKSKK